MEKELKIYLFFQIAIKSILIKTSVKNLTEKHFFYKETLANCISFEIRK